MLAGVRTLKEIAFCSRLYNRVRYHVYLVPYQWFEKLKGFPNMDDKKRYNNFVRMDHDMFEKMVDRLTPIIQKQGTNMRRALEPGLKLAMDITNNL